MKRQKWRNCYSITTMITHTSRNTIINTKSRLVARRQKRMMKISKVCSAFSQFVDVRTRNPFGKVTVRASPLLWVICYWSKCPLNSSKQLPESSNRHTTESSSVAHLALTLQVCPISSKKTPMVATHLKVTRCPFLSMSRRCWTMSTQL